MQGYIELLLEVQDQTYSLHCLIIVATLLICIISCISPSQANFQQSSDHDTFIMNVRSIVESSDSGDRGSNKVAKEGISIGRGGGVISLQSSRRNQRKGGSNEAVSGTAPPSTIAKCNRVEPTASPMASGSGLQGDSAAGHIPSPSLRIGRKQEQNSDGQQEADEPLEWISSCSSLDQLKLDFLPLPNPPSISLDDRSTANHSLLPPHVRNQNMLHQLGGAAPSSSPDYNATVNAVNSISHGPMIGKNDSLDDMIVSSFGLSFLSPEQMPISQESELRTQEEVINTRDDLNRLTIGLYAQNELMTLYFSSFSDPKLYILGSGTKATTPP